MPVAVLPGGKKVAWGKVNKNSTEVPISFGTRFTTEPIVSLTAEWVSGGVGKVETIKTINVENCIIWSGNAAANYYVNWIAIGEGT